MQKILILFHYRAGLAITLNALLTRGEASFEGEVKADGEPLKITLSGKSRFSNFNIFDKANAADLLRWRKFDISGIKFVNEPFRT